MPYIYKITNVINNKTYIGKTSHTTIEQRFKEHLNDAKTKNKGNRPLYKAINKYGAENFSIELIEEVATDEIACERETYWINYYRTYVGFKPCNGYNATLGGDGKSYIDYHEIVDIYKKYKNQRYVAKMLNVSVDTISKVLKLYNIDILPAKDVIQKDCCKKIKMIDNNGTETLFISLHDAARFLKPKSKDVKGIIKHIREVCQGKRKTAYGYRWEYIDEKGEN